MPEHLLNAAQIGSAVEEVGRERMPHRVRRERGSRPAARTACLKMERTSHSPRGLPRALMKNRGRRDMSPAARVDREARKPASPQAPFRERERCALSNLCREPSRPARVIHAIDAKAARLRKREARSRTEARATPRYASPRETARPQARPRPPRDTPAEARPSPIGESPSAKSARNEGPAKRLAGFSETKPSRRAIRKNHAETKAAC